jgi:hypothetical protein
MITGTKYRMWARAASGIAAISALVVAYQAFRWVLIRYWEWQHEGRRMKFTIWAEERALPLAVLAGVFAFYVTLRYFRRRNGS